MHQRTLPVSIALAVIFSYSSTAGASKKSQTCKNILVEFTDSDTISVSEALLLEDAFGQIKNGRSFLKQYRKHRDTALLLLGWGDNYRRFIAEILGVSPKSIDEKTMIFFAKLLNRSDEVIGKIVSTPMSKQELLKIADDFMLRLGAVDAEYRPRRDAQMKRDESKIKALDAKYFGEKEPFKNDPAKNASPKNESDQKQSKPPEPSSNEMASKLAYEDTLPSWVGLDETASESIYATDPKQFFDKLLQNPEWKKLKGKDGAEKKVEIFTLVHILVHDQIRLLEITEETPNQKEKMLHCLAMIGRMATIARSQAPEYLKSAKSEIENLLGYRRGESRFNVSNNIPERFEPNPDFFDDDSIFVLRKLCDMLNIPLVEE